MRVAVDARFSSQATRRSPVKLSHVRVQSINFIRSIPPGKSAVPSSPQH